MLQRQSLLDYTNLFSSNEYENNLKNYTKIFSVTKKFFFYIDFEKVRLTKTYCTKCKNQRKKIKSVKYQIFVAKYSRICSKYESEDKNIFKEKNQLKY